MPGAQAAVIFILKNLVSHGAASRVTPGFLFHDDSASYFLDYPKPAVDATQPKAIELRDTAVPGLLCKITPADHKGVLPHVDIKFTGHETVAMFMRYVYIQGTLYGRFLRASWCRM